MMQELRLKKVLRKRRANSAYQLMLEYKNYMRQRKFAWHQKYVFSFRDINIGLTKKQIEVLRFVGKGFSNAKIAQELSKKEATVKLLIYRLMKYLEKILYEPVDRFYLVIIAQELNL